MKLNKEGKDLIKSFEGCRLVAYKVLPSEQYHTIGYGHHGKDVKEGMTITMTEADRLFDDDIFRFEKAVNEFPFTFKLNQNQFNALVSFTYNLGVNILNDFKGMSAERVASEMLLYVNSGGTRLEGLVNRRKKEVALFNKKEEYTLKEIVCYSGDIDVLSAIMLSQKLGCAIIRKVDLHKVKADKVHYVGGLPGESTRFDTFKGVAKKL